MEGRKVLLIDADPQGSLTASFGYVEPNEIPYTLATVMMAVINEEEISLEDGMLWDVLALYEKTECYNKMPEGEKEIDIWDYMGDKLIEIRKYIDKLFLGKEELRQKLQNVADETEHFVRAYEVPGVVKRWRKINPQILFFECAFDIMDIHPDQYKEISWGLTDLKLACYPDETLIQARKRYFADINKKNEESNLRYTKERIFQNELLRTLTLVFEYDFKEYL